MVAKAEGLSPLEVLRQENELLRQTIADAEAAVGTLENDLKGQGLAPNSVMPRDMDDPVEIWSPSVVVPDGHEMVRAGGIQKPKKNISEVLNFIEHDSVFSFFLPSPCIAIQC